MTPPIPFPFTLLTEPASVAAVEAGCQFGYCYGGDWVQGYVGNYGMEFDGTDEYITTPTATDIEFGNDSTFTIACWVSSSQGSLQGFVSKATQALPNNNGWNMGRTMASAFGSDNVFFASVRSGTNYGFIFSDAAIDDGWHHVAFTRNGSTSGNTILYIDGVAQADTTMGGGAGSNPSNLTDSGTSMLVGRYWDQATGYNLDGKIDEVAVWNVPPPGIVTGKLHQYII